MTEILRDLRQDAMTTAQFLHSIKNASSKRPSIDFWDHAPRKEIERLEKKLSNPNDPERKEIKRILEEIEVESILDAGCGTCTDYLNYRDNGSHRNVGYVGIDWSQRMLAIAKARFPEINVRRGILEDLPFPNSSFDAVVLKHVLEHQPNGYRDTVTEAVRVAKKVVVVDFFHALLPIDIRINDRRGVANNWYGKKRFEEFLLTLPISYFERTVCQGVSGQRSEVYALRK